MTTTDDIQRALREMNDAWTRGDAAAFATCLTEDADYVVFDGTRVRGRADNTALHDALFHTFLRGSRLWGEVESVSLLTPDVALVHGVGAVLWPWQKAPAKKALSRQTTVLVRRDGRWLVRAFHNTRVRPNPPLPGPGSLLVRLFHLFVALRTRLHFSSREETGPGPV